MKTIQREKVEKSVYDVFVAFDGTEFKSHDECKKYEDSAYGVLSQRYQKLVIRTIGEDDLSSVGNGDNSVELIRVNNSDDADIVMQMYFLINPHVLENKSDVYTKWIEQAHALLNRAIEDNDPLAIGRGYDASECFWFIGTQRSMKEQIDFVFKPKEENA